MNEAQKRRQAALQRVAATRQQSLPDPIKAERKKALQQAERKPLQRILDHAQLVGNPTFLEKGWPGLFDQPQAFHLEIGCGYGHFMEWLAPRQPETAFVGLDIVNKVLRRAQIRLKDTDNVALGKLDALYTLRELVAPGTLDVLYILFPDPWFKERHQKRRTLREGTLKLFASRLKVGGQLIFVSDDPPYAADAERLLENCPYFEQGSFPEITVKTKYENKWLAQEKPIHRYAYRRIEHADFAHEVPGWQDAREPLVAQLDVNATSLKQLATRTFPVTYHVPEDIFTFKLQRIYTGQQSGALLIQGVVAEPHSLAQTVWLTLSPSGELRVPGFAPFPYVLRRERVFKAWEHWLRVLLDDPAPEESEEGPAS